MAVTTPRETGTDSPTADLSKKVEVGFAQMEAGFRRADERMDALDKKMDEGFARVDSDVRELRGDMTGLRKELLVAAVIVIAALLGLIGTLIRTHAF
jgi:hypothetical protein